MKVLVIGGSKHGECIEVFDGTRVWVNIREAANHIVRELTWNITKPATGEVTEAYTIRVAVHPDFQGPSEPMVVSGMLQAITMNAYAREHGEEQKIPQEPAGAKLQIPGGAQ